MAGTLLEGKCTAAEEAWRAERLLFDGATDVAAVASYAALVGYEQFMRAAANAAHLLACARAFRAECSRRSFSALLNTLCTPLS